MQVKRLVILNFMHASFHVDNFNQTNDVKALAVVMLRLRTGCHSKLKTDKEVVAEFNEWRGAVNEQDYQFIDFISTCLSHKQKNSRSLLKKEWIESALPGRKKRPEMNDTMSNLSSRPVVDKSKKKPPIHRKKIDPLVL